MQEKDILIKVTLDQDSIPNTISWNADDSASATSQECKAMFLSMYDKSSEETLKLDLWTKEMRVDEMDRMMYHTIRGLADAYFKATQNNKLASAMQQFANYLGEESGVIPKPTE